MAPLEGQGEFLHLHFAEHPLERPVVHLDDVLEDEEPPLDFLGEFRVVLLQVFHDVPLRAPVRVVYDVHDGVDAAGEGKVLSHDGAQLPFQHALHFPEHFRGDPVHPGDPLGHLGLHGPGKAADDGRSLLGFEVGHDEGHGLGMLSLDEAEDLLGVGVPHEVERPDLKAGGYAREKVLRPFLAQGPFEDIPGVVHAAPGHVLPGEEHFLGVFQHSEPLFGAHFSQVRYFKSDDLDGGVIQALVDFRRHLVSKGHHQDGHFFPSCQSLGRCIRHGPTSYDSSASQSWVRLAISSGLLLA